MNRQPPGDLFVEGDPAVDDDVDLSGAAAALSVHYQTAYRWVRTGTLPARVDKGVYRVRRHDIERLRSQRAGPRRRARQVRRSPTSEARARRRVIDALVDGDEKTVRSIARAAASTTSVTALLDDVVAPAMYEIGCRWQDGTLPVWGEHRASAIVGRMLGDLDVTRPGRRRGTAIVTTVAGDQHALPAEMAVAAMREDNWRVHHLGADVPTDDIVDCCQRQTAQLLVITVTRDDHAVLAGEVTALVAGLVPRVLVGGRGRTLAELQQRARDVDARRPNVRRVMP